MLGLTGIPAAIELLLLPFFPESPRYMLIQRGDEKSAKKGKEIQKRQPGDSEEVDEARVELCSVVFLLQHCSGCAAGTTWRRS